jgi:hypothetical protein
MARTVQLKYSSKLHRIIDMAMQNRAGHTFHEKLEKGEPKIVDIPVRWEKTVGIGKMIILTPAIINDFLKTIPKGKLATVNTIRDKFAREFNVDSTCPLTTGIFLQIAVGAAEEDLAAGKKRIAPYWRVLKEGGKLNPKYPGGVQAQAKHLREEGFAIVKGKSENSWRVEDFEDCLMKI